MRKRLLILLLFSTPALAQYIQAGFNKGAPANFAPVALTKFSGGIDNAFLEDGGTGIATPSYVNTLAWPAFGGTHNCGVMAFSYAAGLTISSVTDDKSNTWTSQATVTSGNMTMALYTRTGITAGTKNITVAFTGTVTGDATGGIGTQFSGNAIEFENCGGIGAHGSTTFTANGSAHNITLSGSPSSGDAAVGFFLDSSSYTPDLTSAITVGSGFTALTNSTTYGKLAEINTATTSTSVGATYPNNTHLVFGVAVVVQQGAAGTAASGKYLETEQAETPSAAGTSQTFQFPCGGNMLFAMDTTASASMSTLTTSGWTWNHPAALLETTNAVSQIAYGTGGTCSSASTVAITFSTTPSSPGTSVILNSWAGMAGTLITDNKTAPSTGTGVNTAANWPLATVTATASNQVALLIVAALGFHTVTTAVADDNSHLFTVETDFDTKADDANSSCTAATPASTLEEDNGYAYHVTTDTTLITPTLRGTWVTGLGSCTTNPTGVQSSSTVTGVFN